jgi:sugar phosphate isomerase/epimerase
MLTNPTRRDVLRIGGIFAASGLVAPWVAASTPGTAWKQLPIGTQLWCVRKELASDIPGVLSALAKTGFDGVELENAFGKPGPEWRKHLDAAGLKACGFHHTLGELQGEKLARTIEFNAAISNPYLIVRSLPEETYKSRDLLEKTADAVNEAAEKVKPHKMRVGYHNHSADFNRIDGEYWWNRFADRTTKDVILQLDTGNAMGMEGVSLLDLVRRNAGRTVTMHVKPASRKNADAYIGADELDWPGIMSAAESVGGIEWYIVEYEREGVPPVKALGANLEGFKKLRS